MKELHLTKEEVQTVKNGLADAIERAKRNAGMAIREANSQDFMRKLEGDYAKGSIGYFAYVSKKEIHEASVEYLKEYAAERMKYASDMEAILLKL